MITDLGSPPTQTTDKSVSEGVTNNSFLSRLSQPEITRADVLNSVLRREKQASPFLAVTEIGCVSARS